MTGSGAVQAIRSREASVRTGDEFRPGRLLVTKAVLLLDCNKVLRLFSSRVTFEALGRFEVATSRLSGLVVLVDSLSGRVLLLSAVCRFRASVTLARPSWMLIRPPSDESLYLNPRRGVVSLSDLIPHGPVMDGSGVFRLKEEDLDSDLARPTVAESSSVSSKSTMDLNLSTLLALVAARSSFLFLEASRSSMEFMEKFEDLNETEFREDNREEDKQDRLPEWQGLLILAVLDLARFGI